MPVQFLVPTQPTDFKKYTTAIKTLEEKSKLNDFWLAKVKF